MLPSPRARTAARAALATFGGLGGALKCLQLFTEPLAELGLGPTAIGALGVSQLLAAAAVAPPSRAQAPAAGWMLLVGLLGTAALLSAPSGGPVLALMSLVVPVLAAVALLPLPAAPRGAPAAPAPSLAATLALNDLPIEQSGRAVRPERDRGPRADWASALAEDDDLADGDDGSPGEFGARPPPPVRPRGPW